MKKNLFIFSLFFIISCISTKYKPIDLEKEFQNNLEEKKYTVDKEWWKNYNNKELNKIVNLALQNNIDYIKAAINVNKELYRLRLISSDLYPSVDGNLKATSKRDIYKSEDFADNFSGELGINYELDLYGKIRNSKNAQEFEYKATLMDKEAAKLALINSIIDIYYNLVYLNDSIKLAENDLENYKQIYSITEEKYSSGKIENLEFLKVKQEVVLLENKLIDLETQFKEIEKSMKNLLNLKPSDKFKIVYSNILEVKSIGVNLEIPLSILSERPDLKASEYRLQKAFKKLKAEEKNWYPSISIGGVINSSSNEAKNTFNFPHILGSISIDLSFLDWNRVKNNIKISEMDYKMAFYDFKYNLNTALNEVVYFYSAYLNSENILKNYDKKYLDDEKITGYYKEKYDNGEIEFVDYLNKLNTKNSSKLELIKSKYNYIKYENMIFKIIAGKYSLNEE